MTERIELLKRAFIALMTGFFAVGLLFMVSCDNGDGDDPEPELYDLAGIYTFKEATLESGKDAIAEAIGYPESFIPTDITDEMAGGLLAEANCKDADNGAVKLQSNFELFFTCIDEADSDTKAGTWSVNGDTTELALNLASPPLPTAIQIAIEDLAINETTNVISGSIKDFPLTPDLIAGFFPEPDGVILTQEMIDAILAGLPAAIPVDIDIAFQKISDN